MPLFRFGRAPGRRQGPVVVPGQADMGSFVTHRSHPGTVSSVTTPIKLPRDVRLNHVVDLVSRTHGAHAIHLDFSDFRRADREAAMLLNCALLTRMDNTELTVTPPESDVLMRYGLMFGIANHHPQAVLLHGSHWNPKDDWLADWSRPWPPGSRQQWLRLSGDDLPGEPSVLGPDVAAFVNPHLVPRSPRATRVSHVVRPWLTNLLPPRARIATSPTGLAFLEDIGRAADELVDNVGCHAVLAGHTALSVRSAVFVLLARGNSSSVRDRIYIAVVDSGPGIVGTARPKFGHINRRMTDELLLRALFENNHGVLGRARGFGLPDVLDISRRWRGGSVDCFANGLHASFSDSRVTVSKMGGSIGGSVVILTVHTPPDLRVKRPAAESS